MINYELNNNKKSYTIYCHFSFKRPKGKDYGLFAVAFYSDFIGKKLLVSRTKRIELWENQQFVTAIQSYENALNTIHEFQGAMKNANVRQVMLVTDNSTLAGWIERPSKNKNYYEYMKRAIKNYRVGGAKEIVIGVGLCDARESEKSYKFCKEEKAINEYISTKQKEKVQGYKLEIGEYKSALDIIESDITIPEMNNITEV